LLSEPIVLFLSNHLFFHCDFPAYNFQIHVLGDHMLHGPLNHFFPDFQTPKTASILLLSAGLVSGFLGPFIGAQLSPRRGADAAAFGFLPLFTVPACLVISTLVVGGCELAGLPAAQVFSACGWTNLALGGALAAFTAAS
jgi:hypothetical protein